MREMTIMPFIDATEEHPDVHVGFIDAHSDAEAKQIAAELANDAPGLMDEAVDGWRSFDGLLDQYGIKFGVIEVWQDERPVTWVQPLAPVGPVPPVPSDYPGQAWPAGIPRPPVG
jgi:hypothetical protein